MGAKIPEVGWKTMARCSRFPRTCPIIIFTKQSLRVFEAPAPGMSDTQTKQTREMRRSQSVYKGRQECDHSSSNKKRTSHRLR